MTLLTDHDTKGAGDCSGDDVMSRANDDELTQRVRRIETRLTQLMIALGVNTQAQRPVFDTRNNTVTLPSPHSSVTECIKAIPKDWPHPVQVFVGGDLVAVFALTRGQTR